MCVFLLKYICGSCACGFRCQTRPNLRYASSTSLHGPWLVSVQKFFVFVHCLRKRARKFFLFFVFHEYLFRRRWIFSNLKCSSAPLLCQTDAILFLLLKFSSVQVWGVGGEEALGEALEAREKQREYTAAQIHKARQVGGAGWGIATSTHRPCVIHVRANLSDPRSNYFIPKKFHIVSRYGELAGTASSPFPMLPRQKHAFLHMSFSSPKN